VRRIVLASLLGLSCALWSGGETTILQLAGAQEPKPARVMELVHSQADGASQVLVRVEGAVTHRTERLNNPPRVALDLVGATPAMKMGTLSLKDPRIRQIRSSLYRTDPSTVRVVFDLVAPTEFQVRAVEGGVLVVFSETGVAKGPMPVPAPKAEAPKPSAPSTAGTRLATAPPSPSRSAQAPQAPVPTPAPPARRSQDKLISMDFKDADIHNLLRILAEFSGVNIVAGEDVKGKVTVRLNNVPWDQALDAVVKGAGMAYVREGNIVRVGKLENLSKEAQEQIKLDQAEEESKFRQEQRRMEIDRMRQQAKEEAPLQEEIIPLKYAHVGLRKVELISFFKDSVREQDQKGIEESVKPLLTRRGGVIIDERTNSLIVRDVPDNLDRIKRFIDTVDKPVRTIQIDARIVEINRDEAVALGIQWGGVLTPQTGRNAPVVTTRGNTGPGGTSVVDVLPTLPVGAATGLAVGVIASNFALDAALRALEDRGKANIVSRPSVVTLENQPATVSSGEQVPTITSTRGQGGEQVSISFKDVTTRIQVIPRTTPDNKIALTIGIKKEDLVEIIREPGIVAPRTSTRSGITSLVIDNGQTAVIGGLQVENRNERERGVPFLSRIPVLGWIFKNHTDDSSVKELMIFVTARILETPPKALAPSGETPPGPPPTGGQSPASSAPSEQAPVPSGQASAPIPAAPSAVPSEESKTPARFVTDERSEIWR